MFSAVFDKVVSETSQDAFATFPPPAALPVPSSTLCCLSFMDRFLLHYPDDCSKTMYNSHNNSDNSLVGRASSVGIAITEDELVLTMHSAAELGGRLAAALAGTARPKQQTRDPAIVPVSDLLAKVRGIFGNRLTCIGREIRVSRDEKAERDETLLLDQIHALKNSALKHCAGQKWCAIVSSGGESIAICSIPLSSVEGVANGCDFLVFDPWPRPAMKLLGSYVVKFTTVRGLQLHLLSVLGEIWRESTQPGQKKNGSETVSMLIVMSTQGHEVTVGDLEARRMLEESVTRLRRSEKALAIRKKREEVQALRRALACHGQKPTPNNTISSAAGRFEVAEEMRRTEGAVDDRKLTSRETMANKGAEKESRENGAAESEQLPNLRLEKARSPDYNTAGGFTVRIKHKTRIDEATKSVTTAPTDSIVKTNRSKPEEKKSAVTENVDAAESFVGNLELRETEKDTRSDRAANISNEKISGSAKQLSSPPSSRGIRDAMQRDSDPRAGEKGLCDYQAPKTNIQQRLTITSRQPLWPPAADVSPVRPPRAREHGEAKQSCFNHDCRIGPQERFTRKNPTTGETEAKTPTVPAVASYTRRISEDIWGNSPFQQIDQDDCMDIQDWGGIGWTGETPGFPRTGAAASASDKASTRDDPLHRVLLRSVEGEGLAEYSLRAYNFYRTYGVILDETPAHRVSILSGDSRHMDVTMSGPAVLMSGVTQNSATVAGPDSPRRLTEGRYDEEQGSPDQNKRFSCNAGSEPVHPFSPPSRVTNRTCEESAAADSISNTINGQQKRETSPEKLTLEKVLAVYDSSDGGKTPQGTEDTLQSPTRPKVAFRSRIQVPRAGLAATMAATTARRRHSLEEKKRASPDYRRQERRGPNGGNTINTSFRLRQKSKGINDDDRTTKPPVFQNNSLGTDTPPPPPPPTDNVVGPNNGHEACCSAEGGLAANLHRRSRPQLVEAWRRNEPHSNDISSTDDTTIQRCVIAAQTSSGRGKSKDIDVRKGSTEGNRTNSVAGVKKSTSCSPRCGKRLETSTLCENGHPRQLSVTLRVGAGWRLDPSIDDEGIYPTGDDPRVVEQTRQTNSAAKSALHAVQHRADSPDLKSVHTPTSNARGSRVESCQAPNAECNRPHHVDGEIVVLPKTLGSPNTNKRTGNPRMESAVDCVASATPDIETDISTQRITAAAEKQRHDEGFVWFGQPDTSPTGQQSDEKRRDKRWRHVNPAFSRQDEVTSISDSINSPLRKRQSKSELILQIEVRRQRNIIDRASQAREEEGRARRARVGAKVLKMIKCSRDNAEDDLMAAATPSQAHQDSPQKQFQPNLLKREPGRVTCNDVGLREYQEKTLSERCPRELGNTSNEVKKNQLVDGDDTSTDQQATSQDQVADGKGVCGGEVVEIGASSKTYSERPPAPRYSGAAIRDEVMQQVEKPSLKRLSQKDLNGYGQDLASAAEASPPKALENPWRKIRRTAGGELVPAIMAPTPPSIRFDVAADELRGGRRGGGCGGDEDQARRRERFEALRRRKLLETEERRQSQRGRQATARQAHLTLAITAVAPTPEERVKAITITDDEHRNGPTPRTQHYLEKDAASQPSVARGEHPRPPDYLTLSARGNYSPSDGDGKEGGGGGGLRAGRAATPGRDKRTSVVVRGFSRRSNRKLVRNAITFLCLAGGHLKEQKARVLEALDSSRASNFVLLLAHTKLLTFKGLYSCGEEEHVAAERIFGLGPARLETSTISGFYKYNSAAREFREVHSKTLGKTTDAVSVEPTKLLRPKGLAAHQTP